MDLRALSYFVVIAEELNITRAAEKLNMSQPPLSKQLKSMEEELNTVLFIRGKRHLKLTESGQLLYRRAKEILSLTEKAETEIISMNSGVTGTISIGIVEGIVPHMVAKWVHGFLMRYPNVRFRILDSNSDDLIEKMRAGTISLAVIAAPYDQLLLNSFSVGSEKVSAFIPTEHPLAKKDGDTVSVDELKGEPLILTSRKASQERVYKWFRAENSEPNIICETDSHTDVVALAQRGVGIGLFPRTNTSSKSDLVIKNVEGEDMKVDYLFVWRKGHPLPSIEEAFIDYVKEQTKNL